VGRRYQDLALTLAGGGGDGFFDLRDVIGRLNRCAQLARRDQAGERGEHGALSGLRGCAKPVCQPEAPQRDIAEYQVSRRHGTRLAAERAVIHDGAALGHAGGQPHGGRAAHSVDAQADGGPTGGCLDALGKVITVDENRVPASSLHAGHGRFAAYDIDGLQTPQTRQLHQIATHTRVGAVPG
jgi:hypothetical protein